MGAGPAAIVLGRRGSDAARISDPRSRLRPDGGAIEGRQHSTSHRRDGDRRREGPRRQDHAGTFPVITGLDHIVVLLGDIKAGAKTYELLLGRAPSWRSENDGAETVLFTLNNMTLELMAPAGNAAAADRIRDVIKAWGEGLASLCFAVGDIEKTHRRLDRVALKPDRVAEVESRDLGSGALLRWK